MLHEEGTIGRSAPRASQEVRAGRVQKEARSGSWSQQAEQIALPLEATPSEESETTETPEFPKEKWREVTQPGAVPERPAVLQSIK